MEQVKKGYFNLAVKWAVIYTITSIVIVYLYQFTNVEMTTSPLRYLSYIPLIAFMFLAQKEYRDQLGGFMTFGEGFMTGFMYSVVAGVLGAIFVFLYFSYLSPQVWEQSLAAAREKLEESKGLSSEQIDQAMNITTKYGIIIAVVGSIIGSPILGAIISLIGAAIFKKERGLADIEQAASSTYHDPTV